MSNATIGRELGKRIFRYGIEEVDECRCGNSRIQVKDSDERVSADDIQSLVDYTHALQKESEAYATIQRQANSAWVLEFQSGGRFSDAPLTLGDSITVSGGKWMMNYIGQLEAGLRKLREKPGCSLAVQALIDETLKRK